MPRPRGTTQQSPTLHTSRKCRCTSGGKASWGAFCDIEIWKGCLPSAEAAAATYSVRIRSSRRCITSTLARIEPNSEDILRGAAKILCETSAALPVVIPCEPTPYGRKAGKVSALFFCAKVLPYRDVICFMAKSTSCLLRLDRRIAAVYMRRSCAPALPCRMSSSAWWNSHPNRLALGFHFFWAAASLALPS